MQSGFAGRVFYFDISKNKVALRRLNAKLQKKEITQFEYNTELLQLIELTGKYSNGVKFNDTRFPDFSPFIAKNSKIKKNPVPFPTTGNRSTDFTECDKIEGITAEDRKINGWVWHHHEDMKTMYLMKQMFMKQLGILEEYLYF